MVNNQETVNAQQSKPTYPSYLDLLTEEQFAAFEKGIRLARQEKNDEAVTYFQDLLSKYADQPHMLAAVCIVLADLGKEPDVTATLALHAAQYQQVGMYHCALARIELAAQKLDTFEDTFLRVKEWLNEHQPKKDGVEVPYAQQLEHAVVFAEAAYLGVRYCIEKRLLGQAAYLIQTYEEMLPHHDMFIALKLFLAQALQKALPDFAMPKNERDFEPFMNHVIAQIVEQNKPEEEAMAQEVA